MPGRQLYAMNPVTGGIVWATEIGEEDPIDGGGIAVAGTAEALFTASYQSIYRVDPVTRTEVWRKTLADLEPKRWGTHAIVVAGERIYARAVVVNDANAEVPFNVLYCYDLGGELLWSHRIARTDPPREVMGGGFRIAVGDGLLVAVGQDGTVRVFGRTPASLALDPHPTDLYPAPGEIFGVELSDVEPGAFGPATEWRVEWGDGNVTEWTPNHGVTHSYATAGDVTARFQARNAANQTTSSFVVFHVGAQAPVPLTPLQRAFSPEFQNWTFFILGTAATAVGGAIGFYRIRAKRRVLQRELRRLDQDYLRLKEKPADCEAMLADARMRARGLLISGKFEESHFAVLDLRITELGRGIRLAVLDARFDHLPHGMVKTIREMLEDGRIGRVEREHFVELLRRDALLSPEQKARILALVDEWFAKDSRSP